MRQRRLLRRLRLLRMRMVIRLRPTEIGREPTAAAAAVRRERRERVGKQVFVRVGRTGRAHIAVMQRRVLLMMVHLMMLKLRAVVVIGVRRQIHQLLVRLDAR